MKDKISLIVPFYNSKKTIKRCVGSILNQTYKNFELLLVNDGGTDESVEIVKEYAKNDARVKFIDKEHSGVSSTRNEGLRQATGDFIQFIDSDDDVEPNMLEVMYNSLIENDADVCICNYTHPSIKNHLGDCVLDLTNKNDLLRFYQTTFSCVVPWNKLYKRSVIKEYFDSEVHFCEDDLFCITNIFNAKKLVSVSKELYHYYVPPKEEAELSTINALANADKFWETKKTYWYMRNELNDKTRAQVSKHFTSKEDIDDFVYVRSYDFLIWEILILASCGVEKPGLSIEITNILNEPDFKHSINMRKRYGIALKDYTNIDEAGKIFVDKCYKVYEQYKDSKEVRPFYICQYIFIDMFIEKIGDLSDCDIISYAFKHIDDVSNKEALIARNI